MLSMGIELPADARIGLVVEAFNPDRVLMACREQLTHIPMETRSRWTCCRVVEALYHPDRYIRVAYALLDDETIPLNRNWPQGQIVYLHAPLREPMSRRGHVLTLDETKVEIYLFPNDRRLRGLRKFQGRTDASEVWQNWIDASPDDFQIDPQTLRRVMIRYVPEQKWIVRLRARGVETGTGAASKRSIAVRSASSDSCEELARRHQSLSDQWAACSVPFTIPAVIGTDIKGGLIATEWIKGQSLVETLQSESPRDVMHRVVEVLSSFHGMDVDRLPMLTGTGLRRRVQMAVADLVIACPELKDELRDIDEKLQHSLGNIHMDEPMTLHNDFHWNQLRINGDRVALMDLERMCIGDPLIDVANFAGQVRMLGLRPEHNIDSTTATTWAYAFLEEWSVYTCQNIHPVRFRSYLAVSLLELARGMMRHLRPGWHELTHRCIDLAIGDLGSLSKETASA